MAVNVLTDIQNVCLGFARLEDFNTWVIWTNRCYINRCPIINPYIRMNILCGTVWLQWVVESVVCIMGTGEITRGATDSLLKRRIVHIEGWRSFWTVISVAKLKIDMYGCNLVKTDVFLPFCNITVYANLTVSVTLPYIDICLWWYIQHNFFLCHT